MNKIINKVTRINSHRKDKDGMPISAFGAIVCFGNCKWFVDLDEFEDERAFNKFVEEESFKDKWTWEDTFPSKFCVEDVDTEWYRYYVDDITEERPYGSKCINAELEV